MVTGKWWLAGLGVACVACCAAPLLGGAAAVGTGLTLGFGWSGLVLFAVGAAVIAMVAMRPGRAALACGTAVRCGCGPAPATAVVRSGDERPPIVCTLTGDDFAERTAWIRQLAEEYLLSVRRAPLRLELTYASGAADHVREMVGKERACCAFLTFALLETREGMQLTITAPEEAGESAGMLFDHFAPKPQTMQNKEIVP